MTAEIVSDSEMGRGTTYVGSRWYSKEAIFVAGFVVFGLLIRALLLSRQTVINGDGIYYVNLGQAFVKGDLVGGISAYWSPLYSTMVGVVGLVLNDTELGGRLVSLIAGSLLILATYILGKRFYGQAQANIASLLVAAHPMLIRASVWVMTESLYSLLFILLILTNWTALGSGRRSFYLASGLLLGSAYLTKPEAIGYWALIALQIIVVAAFTGRSNWRRSVTGFAILTIGFLSLSLPYVIFLKYKTGEWTISQKMATNLPVTDETEGILKLDRHGDITMMDRIWGDNYNLRHGQEPTTGPAVSNLEDPGFFEKFLIVGTRVASQVKKQIRDYIPAIAPYPFLALMLVGFTAASWSKARAARELYLAAFLIATILGYALSVTNIRYSFPLIPILMLWAANGVVEFSLWLSDTTKNLFRYSRYTDIRVLQIVVASFLLLTLTYSSIAIFGPEDPQGVPFEEKRAGLWIRERSPTEAPIVISSQATPAYYAQGKHLFLPDEPPDTIMGYARRQNANYIVLDTRRNPQFSKAEIQSNFEPAGFSLVYSEVQDPGREIYVLEVPRN